MGGFLSPACFQPLFKIPVYFFVYPFHILFNVDQTFQVIDLGAHELFYLFRSVFPCSASFATSFSLISSCTACGIAGM